MTQFLTLPTAPIVKKLRLKLAESYADKPGVNNDSWKKAINNFKENFEDSAGRIDSMLKLWFERERFHSSEGTPKKAVLDL